MGYRILVDENINPRTARLLRDRGHDAVHIEETLGKGTADVPMAAHARERGCLVLTNDADFLRPTRRTGLTVLYVSEHTMRAHDIVAAVDEFARFVPDQADLPPVAWLTRR